MNIFPAGFQSLTTVRFQGTVIALACDDQKVIRYRVFDPAGDPESEGAWSPAATLVFPEEVRAVGASVLTLMTTSVYGAASPMAGSVFSAVADDTHIYIFRPSTQNTLLVDRFLLIESAGEETMYVLEHVWEVRYQRSQNRDLPATPRDTFGYRSLDGDPFIEPTIDLTTFVTLPSGASGGFCVALVPGKKGAASRWLVVVTTANTLSWTLFDRGDDGLFIPVEGQQPPSLTLNTSDDVSLTSFSAPAALIYSQQEQIPTALAKDEVSLKRSVHLLFALSASTGGQTSSTGIALLDLALDAAGELAKIPSSPVTLPSRSAVGALPVLHRHAGLPISGAFVTAASAAGAVWPLDSGDGLVHIYYRNSTTGQLNVLQFQPLIDRVVYRQRLGTAIDPGGELYFTARFPGLELRPSANQKPISIQGSFAGYGAYFCDTTMLFPKGEKTLTETWALVPTDLGAFLQVLTGQARYLPEDDDDVIEGNAAFFNYYGSDPNKGRRVFACGSNGPFLLWFVLRGETSALKTASVAFVVNVATQGSTPMLTLSCTVAYPSSGSKWTTYQEVWLNIPLADTTSCADVAAILNGKPGQSAIRYDYDNARYYRNGVLDDAGLLAGGSKLFMTIALVAGMAFSPGAVSWTLPPGNAVSLQNALPLSGSVRRCGPQNYISMAASTGWSGLLTTSFTIEAWMRPGSKLADSAAVLALCTSRGWGSILILGYDSTNMCVAAYLATGGNQSNQTYPTITSTLLGAAGPADTGWHHVALVYDASAGKGRVYLDGIGGDWATFAVSGASLTLLSGLVVGCTWPVTQGSGPALSLPFSGDIAEVRLWKQALSADELRVRCLIAVQDEPGLVARWPLNEPAGATLAGYPTDIGNATAHGTRVVPPSGIANVQQGVSYSISASDKVPPVRPGSQLYIPSAFGVSPGDISLANLLGNGKALNPTRFWPSSDTLRMPSLVAEPSLYSLGIGLNGMGGASVVTFANKPTTFNFLGDISFETWINPASFTANQTWVQRIVEYRQLAGPSPRDFAVALRNLWAVKLTSGNWLEMSSLPIPGSVTILLRLSMTPPQNQGDQKMTIIGKYSAAFDAIVRVRWTNINASRFMVVIGENKDDGTKRTAAKFPIDLPDKTFVLAIVLQPATTQGTNVWCYVDGEYVPPGEDSGTGGEFLSGDDSYNPVHLDESIAALYESGCGDGDWVIGMDWEHMGKSSSEFLSGTIDEVQIWSKAITDKNLLSMNAALTGEEPGLITYLTLNEGPDSRVALDRSTGQNHARLMKSTGSLPEWVPSLSGNTGFASVAFGGGSRGSGSSTGTPIAAGQWSHLAVTYQSNYLVKFNGSQRIVCGSNSDLDFDRALTIEVWIAGDGNKPPAGTIFSKWGATEADRSFLLQIDDDGFIVFSVSTSQQVATTETETNQSGTTSKSKSPANPDDSTIVLTSKHALTAHSDWYYIAAIFAADVQGEQGSSGGATYNPEDVASTVTMSLFLNGAPDAQSTLPQKKKTEDSPTPTMAGRIEIRTTEADAIIGDTAGRSVAPLTAARVAELRAWERPLDAQTIAWVWQNRQIPSAQDGLVAYWAMDEGKGRVVHDRAGGNDGASAQPLAWDYSELAAVWRLYLNGVEQPCVSLPGYDVSASGTTALVAGLTLGGCTTGASQYADPLKASLSELRVWSSLRSPGEIRQWMRTRVSSRDDHLVGYWPVGPEVASGTLHDSSKKKNDGTLHNCTSSIDNVPPLRNELSFVVDAFYAPPGGSPRSISGPPAVFEYGQLAYDTDGKVAGGILQRAYAYPTAEGISVSSALVVGSLRATFLGQAQFAPTLIGFIEGAPPVPSENLTRPYWLTPASSAYLLYNGTSTITLQSTAKEQFTFSSSRDQSYKTSVTAKASGYLETKVGYKVMNSIIAAYSKGELGVQVKFDHSLGWISSAARSNQTSWKRTDSLDLRGQWESPQPEGSSDYQYARLGRRFLPNNVGYALVRSGTADVFALTLEQTGALVAYQMAPHPDIPEDWNIITFPIDTDYVENGVLDGYVGFWPRKPPSYFRVVEAYRLKRAVEQETKELAMYYEQLDAGAEGRSGTVQPGDDKAAPAVDEPLRRSLVNTYVWTASGGLHAEQMQALNTWESSSGGSYDFTHMGGIFQSLTLGIELKDDPALVGTFLSLTGELRASYETLFGGQLKTTVTKSRTGETALEINVGITGESWLHRWDEKTPPDTSGFTPEQTPGKVDGYRFMTFYLSPSRNHADKFFEEVVDRNWLQGSPNPSARALRAARASANGVWRVLHRVTYVSRVQPRTENDLDRGLPPEDTKNLGPAVLNEQNNSYVIALAQKSLSGRVTWQMVASAVNAMKLSLPWTNQLKNWSVLRPRLVTYLGAYFGLPPDL